MQAEGWVCRRRVGVGDNVGVAIGHFDGGAPTGGTGFEVDVLEKTDEIFTGDRPLEDLERLPVGCGGEFAEVVWGGRCGGFVFRACREERGQENHGDRKEIPHLNSDVWGCTMELFRSHVTPQPCLSRRKCDPHWIFW